MKGTDYNPEAIKSAILQSWVRCRAIGVQVGSFDEENLVSPREIQDYTVPLEDPVFRPFCEICKDLGIPDVLKD